MTLFSKVAVKKTPHSKFKNSFNRKISFKSGCIVPVLCKEVIPGDSFIEKANAFVRQMPMVAPMMHEMNLNFSWFFVPYRLVWDESEEFFTGGEDGTLSPEKPHFRFTGYDESADAALRNVFDAFSKVSTLPDYLGFPTTQVDNISIGGTAKMMRPTNLKVDMSPFRAYQLVYNYYFRDQNVQDEVKVNKTSGLLSDKEVEELVTLRRCCWKKDYFTSALPFAQRGPEVTFDIGDSAQLVFDNNKATAITKMGNDFSVEEPANLKGYDFDPEYSPSQSLNAVIGDSSWDKANNDTYNVDVTKNTSVDLSTAKATSINELRRMSRLQEWFETKARGGARYIEQIFSFFGVVSDDARLDMPEYLGGGVQPFVIDSVAQTSSTNNELSPLATLGGKGISVGNIGLKSKQFKEHGFLFCLAFARPKASYMQGLPKLFTRFDSLDYYWPTFARLGEQEVKNSELYLDKNMNYNDATFGYQSRYADYKYTPDTIAGQLKTDLDFWHMARKFKGDSDNYESSDLPTLSSNFVECNPTKRIYAITDSEEDELILEVQFHETAYRRMPFHITPKL